MQTPLRFQRPALHPAAAGLALVALLGTGFGLLEWSLGRLDDVARIPSLPRNLRIGAVIVLLLGYLVTAHGYLMRWTRESFRALRPLLVGAPDELDALEAEVGAAPPRAARRAGAIGVLLALCAGPLVDRGFGDYFTPGYWGPETAAHWLAVPFVGWLGGRLMFASLRESRRVAALADRLGPIDLLAPERLTPFGRQGLRTALLWLVFIAILSLLLANRGFGPLLALFGLLTFYTALRAMLLPVRRVRERVLLAKRTELENLRAELQRDRETLRRLSAEAPAAAARLPGLLAYEQRIQAVREWPFSAPMLARFLLYLVIPVGSWLGGALVERGLGAVLD